MYRESALTRLTYFSVPEGFGVDPCHDFEEGYIKYLKKSLFDIVIQKGLCTEDEIKDRIYSFNYGTIDQVHRIKNLNIGPDYKVVYYISLLYFYFVIN